MTDYTCEDLYQAFVTAQRAVNRFEMIRALLWKRYFAEWKEMNPDLVSESR